MADPAPTPAGAGLAEGAEIPGRSPEEGARRLALFYLDQAAAALPRLHDGADREALHDLRVALRRLRSCLQGFAAQLGDSVPRKLARRLRRIAGATGPGRDAEVQLAWLRKHTAELGRHQRSGHAWLAKRLEERRETAYGKLRADLATDFAPLEEALRRRLSVYRTEVRLDGGRVATFSDVAAALAEERAGDLDRRLRKIDDPAAVAAAHEARIAAKRLRYLADPLSQMIPGHPGAPGHRRQAAPAPWTSLLADLKELQDLLGDLHDSHVLEADLTTALGAAAAERAGRLLELTLATNNANSANSANSDSSASGEGDASQARLRAERRRPYEPGLLALARINRARRDQVFAALSARWPEDRREQVRQSVKAMAQALLAAGHPNANAEEPNGEAP